MEKMKGDTPIDYAVFQLSPRRSRCELFASSGGNTEKLASGLLKPFVAQLQVAEEQVASTAQSIKLEVGRCKTASAWFTKGTLDRFVRFVSTPEILEVVSTFDAEMSQLEAARRIYSQGAGDHLSGGGGSLMTAADDATKKELLGAIDVRLVAVQQDLFTACARAAAAGFSVDTVSELQMFADSFGAHRLKEACAKFISLCQRRPNLLNQWKYGNEDRAVRSSCSSDMSIDDDPPSPSPAQDPATYQQPNHNSITFPSRSTLSREPSVERDDKKKPGDAVTEKDSKDDTSNPDQTGSIQASQSARRLSVQDRINLFETKQKESSGGKPVVTKSVELRRMSSDVSTMGAVADKAVLRRWSGDSDMSIDLSVEKKDIESPSCTLSAAGVSEERKVLNVDDDAPKSAFVVKPEIKVIPGVSRDHDSILKESSNKSQQFSEQGNPISMVPCQTDGLKDHVLGKTRTRSSISRLKHTENSEEKFKNLVGDKNESSFVFRDQGKLKGSQSDEDLRGKDQGSSAALSSPIEIKGSGQVNIPYQREDSELRDETITQVKSLSLTSTRKNVGESASRIREAFIARYKGIESDSSTRQQLRSVGETKVVEKKEASASEKVSSDSVSGMENYGPRSMNFNRQGSAAELNKKAKVLFDGNCFSGTSRTQSSGKVTTEPQESSDSFTTPLSDRERQSKGNEKLNNELKMKANDLEKLFAEHKLRVPGDQSNSTRKGKLESVQCEPASTPNSRPVSNSSSQMSDSHKSNKPTGSSKNKTSFNTPSLAKTVDSKSYDDALNSNFSELSVSEGSRGKLYDKYIQKRDAKLKEEWSSNRGEKEARLKLMLDSLERNRSEMKAKFSGSADRQDPLSSTRQRAERLRSYNSRSIMNREQQYLDFGDSDNDNEASSFLEKTAAQGKKLLPNNKNLSLSTPCTSAAPVPKSATKASTNSVKRRPQPEKPLMQSVPSFSDLRKENTKPSGGSKTTRSQVRNYARSKSTIEEAAIIKEDKSRRSHALRKSSANPSEFREMSSLESDVVLPIKFDEEVPKNVGSKPFLKKGRRASFVARTSIARQLSSVVSEPVNVLDENDDMVSGPDEIDSTFKDEVEVFDSSIIEGHENLEDGGAMLRSESDKFVNSESENGDGTLTFSRVDQALGSQLTGEIPSSFLPVDSIQDWSVESPTSWNSRTQHSFTYNHEMSDVDASVDSLVGSPLWNQMEVDAARMRKKWGTAQKPMLVNNNLSRKDMTRGFKRLLKFGRKNRGSENLVDWISATTSEGDDDTEDGRDPATRSSEDIRKSRMGFSRAPPCDDSFNESEFCTESVQSSESFIPVPPTTFKLREDHISETSIKAPRSFFSLSTFRSKGSETKPR